MINCFSFASFKLLLLFLTFYILIITCFGVGPLSSSQLELSGLPESVCLVLSPGLGNLSTIISSKKISAHLSFSSHSETSIKRTLVCLVFSYWFLKLSSFFFHFSFFLFLWLDEFLCHIFEITDFFFASSRLLLNAT